MPDLFFASKSCLAFFVPAGGVGKALRLFPYLIQPKPSHTAENQTHTFATPHSSMRLTSMHTQTQWKHKANPAATEQNPWWGSN